MRRRMVVDRKGDEVGKVEGWSSTRRGRRVRFLEVGSNGFFGLGERMQLVPVEAISRVTEDVSPERAQVAHGPLSRCAEQLLRGRLRALRLGSLRPVRSALGKRGSRKTGASPGGHARWAAAADQPFRRGGDARVPIGQLVCMDVCEGEPNPA
ncbi:PRC-barrel domain-containing protein [Kribbella pittospori]|uniref:PRC-barrel domain-containing protein n=1 Tax=Kribbella pittospori TaxID=722689 RepID=UPI003B50ADA2